MSGGNPIEFGTTPDEFHTKTAIRAQNWPHSMLATSTHDSKLSEDVRARINALSEVPAQWRLKVRQWRLLNQRKKLVMDGLEAPTRNDEYLFYQVLIGAWPPGEKTPTAELRGRLKNYMLKAAREQKNLLVGRTKTRNMKMRSGSFVESVLDATISQEFIADFLDFQRRIAAVGALNSLSQILIKLASPGVPDIYQGNELYEFRLVDPDNRQPVDYTLRQKLLCEWMSLPCCEYKNKVGQMAQDLTQGQDDQGRMKLFLTWGA